MIQHQVANASPRCRVASANDPVAASIEKVWANRQEIDGSDRALPVHDSSSAANALLLAVDTLLDRSGRLRIPGNVTKGRASGFLFLHGRE
jgi:hypothetical protein